MPLVQGSLCFDGTPPAHIPKGPSCREDTSYLRSQPNQDTLQVPSTTPRSHPHPTTVTGTSGKSKTQPAGWQTPTLFLAESKASRWKRCRWQPGHPPCAVTRGRARSSGCCSRKSPPKPLNYGAHLARRAGNGRVDELLGPLTQRLQQESCS